MDEQRLHRLLLALEGARRSHNNNLIKALERAIAEERSRDLEG